MKKRAPKQYDDDDGRTICDMNVPGMPWYERDRRRAERDEQPASRENIARVAGRDAGVDDVRHDERHK